MGVNQPINTNPMIEVIGDIDRVGILIDGNGRGISKKPWITTSTAEI